VARSLEQWHSELEDIRSGLGRRSAKARQFAVERLMAIRDVSAIPAIEMLWASNHRAMAHVAVAALGNLSQHEASLALARIAVFSPWPDVNQAATQQLADRPREGYVPALLAEMSSPIESRYRIARIGASVYYRHAFVQERQGDKQLSVLDFQHLRLPPRQGRDTRTQDPNVTIAEARQNLRELDQRHRQDRLTEFIDSRVESQLLLLRLLPVVRQREAQRLACNEWIRQCNERIRQVLAGATGQIELLTPLQWWDWWNHENQVARSGPKYCNLRYSSQGNVTQSTLPGYAVRVNKISCPPSCFVAGTPVLTLSGPLNIEDVQPGDLVLGQDVDTGQLAYQPVLATTRRPEFPTFKIRTIQGEQLVATGGHAFWVSGTGWVRATDLESGMRLHTLRGGVGISAVDSEPPRKSYNLVVADFHSYFVGSGNILCHDNTLFEPTNAVLPGLHDD
jgi:hypothetical protein